VLAQEGPAMSDDPLAADERPIINFAGELVALGPMRRDLIPAYQRWINDFAVVRSLAGPIRPLTLEAETAWYDGRANADGEAMFIIYERPGLRPVGNSGLFQIDLRDRTAEFGIVIGEADARGKGYGTETARLVLDYAFTALGLINVMLTVFEFNLAAQRAYEKAGFKPIGRRRQAKYMGGRFWDVVYMDCLASEFESPVLSRILTPDPPRA
jgi:RimJ/RimL family protein N-acetyltransferase